MVRILIRREGQNVDKPLEESPCEGAGRRSSIRSGKASEEINSVDMLTSEIQPPELGEALRYLSHLICVTLLWQSKQANTVNVCPF